MKMTQSSTLPTVLVAGFDSAENPISRTLRKQYGINPDWLEPGKSIRPHLYEIAIIGKSFINTSRYREVQDAFKEQKKPVFITNSGFSEIKQSLEDHLFERGKKQFGTKNVVPVASGGRPFNSPLFVTTTQVRRPAPALAAPAAPTSPPTVIHTKPTLVTTPAQTAAYTPILDENNIPKHTPERLEKIYKIVYECTKAGMGGLETVEMLTLEGYKKASGVEYIPQDVYSMRLSLKNQDWKPEGETENIGNFSKQKTKPFPAAAANPVTPMATPTPAPAPTPSVVLAPIALAPTSANPAALAMELIGHVLNSALPTDQKIAIVQKIQLGEIKSLKETKFEVVEMNAAQGIGVSMTKVLVYKRIDILNPAAAKELVLTKELTNELLNNMALLHKFVTTEAI